MQRTITCTRLPLGILQALHTLKIHDIRISKLDAKRAHAMEIEQKMMLCCTFSYLVYRIDGLLVIPVKEIHLESLDTHISIILHDFLHLFMTTLNQIAP